MVESGKVFAADGEKKESYGEPEDNVMRAVSNLACGYSCSEAVVAAYAPLFGMARETAARISAGFGGGMAQGKTCGAVTGAYMVISLKYGAGTPVTGFQGTEPISLSRSSPIDFASEREPPNAANCSMETAWISPGRIFRKNCERAASAGQW